MILLVVLVNDLYFNVQEKKKSKTAEAAVQAMLMLQAILLSVTQHMRLQILT